ncbi:MAG: class I SAM-dependent methyltransferase [Planctomycetota bacterium]
MTATPSYWEAARDVSGWLTAREGRWLHDAARQVPAGGTIVEIGSFLGRSTICLARGAQAGATPTPRIVAVDPHLGSPKHAHLLQCEETYAAFLANLERAGVRDVVTPRHQTSVAAAAEFDAPIDLLFIDGAHELDLVRADFEHWFPKVRVGGRVAFHDSWHMLGPHRVTTSILLGEAPVAQPELIDTITTFVKVERRPRAATTRHAGFVTLRALRGAAGFLRLTYRGTKMAPVPTR